MISNKFISAAAFLCLIWCVSGHVQAKEPNLLVGSIPGDPAAKKMLGIDALENVDFIRLRIALNEGERKFELSAAYGIGKPNTRDFENGGKTISAKGQLEITDKDGYLVYRFFANETGIELSLIRLNDSMFHILSRDGRLMSGSGGWNYTLCRETGSMSKSALPKVKNTDSSDEPEIVIFSGRTPCVEIGREMKMAVADDCSKLKWKLTLHRDPGSNAADTFVLLSTFHRTGPLQGTWKIVKDSGSVIYRLNGNDGSKISFLRLDNSLLFLDNGGQLLKGNGEFGYTLDRKKDVTTSELQKAKME